MKPIGKSEFDIMKSALSGGMTQAEAKRAFSRSQSTIHLIYHSEDYTAYKEARVIRSRKINAVRREKKQLEAPIRTFAATPSFMPLMRAEDRTVVELRAAKAQVAAEFDTVINHLIRLNGGQR